MDLPIWKARQLNDALINPAPAPKKQYYIRNLEGEFWSDLMGWVESYDLASIYALTNDNLPKGGHWFTSYMPPSAFRLLGAREVVEFKQWAREHHTAGGPISGFQHPIIQLECMLINRGE